MLCLQARLLQLLLLLLLLLLFLLDTCMLGVLVELGK
jgi:hypothetical protein